MKFAAWFYRTAAKASYEVCAAIEGWCAKGLARHTPKPEASAPEAPYETWPAWKVLECLTSLDCRLALDPNKRIVLIDPHDCVAEGGMQRIAEAFDDLVAILEEGQGPQDWLASVTQDDEGNRFLVEAAITGRKTSKDGLLAVTVEPKVFRVTERIDTERIG